MKQKSFTLIELLVVIVIIGILAGVIMISTSSSIDKANFAKAKAFSSTVQNELLSNLVSEWTFDNASNIGEDTWGNNDGLLVGDPQSMYEENCVFGGCLDFDGDDYINYNLSNSLRMTGSQTITLWYKYNSVVDIAETRGFLGGVSFSSAINCGHAIAVNVNGSIYSDIYSGDPYGNHRSNLVVSVPKDTNWHFIVSGYNASVNKHYMYLDGIIYTRTPNFLNYRIDWGSNPFRIANSNYIFKGLMDDVRIYDIALSSAEIKQNYIAGLNSMLSSGSISKEEYNERINTLAYDK